MKYFLKTKMRRGDFPHICHMVNIPLVTKSIYNKNISGKILKLNVNIHDEDGYKIP